MVLGGVVRSAGRIAGLTGSVTSAVATTTCRTAVRTAESAAKMPLRTMSAAFGATGTALAATEAVVAAAPALVGSGSTPGRLVGDVLAAGSQLTARAASEAVQVPVRTVRVAGDVARHGLSAAEQAPRHAVGLAKALTDLHPRRTRRRVWQNRGHAQIEVRGLSGDGPRQRRVASAVRRALNGLSGVRWAEINAITGQVLVAFDEGRVDVGTLLDTIRAVEAAQGTREEEFSWERPVHPSDATPLGAAVVQLAADYVAVSAAIAGRVVRVPPLPRGVRVTLTLLDLQPELRRRLRAHIGPLGTDVVMSLAYAGISGLSQRPLTPAIDAIYRTELMAEVLARQVVWRRREPELCCAPESLPDKGPAGQARPVPLPKGPLESWVDTLGPGSLAGAATVLLLTRESRRAADTILAAVPRAARLGRESFAATAARRLSRRGVVPLDAAAYRRLDRVSAIVVDSSALCTDRPTILTAEGEHGDVRTVWRAANRMLRERTMAELEQGMTLTGDGSTRLQRDPRVKNAPPGVVPLVLRQGNRRLGRVLVGGELAPLADAVIDAARETGARVLTTDHAVVREMLPQTDEVLPASESLAAHVRRLQEEGHGVLCISGIDEEALDAADVAVGVLPDGGGCSTWSADLLCGPGLEDVWRVLGVVAAAGPLSQRVVRVAQAATALGTLLALVGGRRRSGKTHALAPVHSSALLGLYQGARAARRATRRGVPVPVVHVPWHALDPVDVLERLEEISAQDGAAARWSPQETARQLREQARTLAGKPGPRYLLAPVTGTYALGLAIREELEDPLTPVLALGATASAIVGSAVDAFLVGTVLTGNAFVSGAQRWRAERSLNQLLVQQSVTAHRVRRSALDLREVLPSATETTGDGGQRLASLPLRKVRASRLVLGDVVSLRAGDVVPADARIVCAWDLEVDESSLTGESVPVRKDAEATPGVPLPERSGMVFEGTTVLAGTGYAVVVATGDSTEAGRAARSAGRAAPAAGIQARLMEITRIALPATALGGAGVAGLGLLRGLPLREAIAAGVSVAVAAVPEGLPLVATVAQAGAARRLSRRGVLVRSSRTLESLGRVDTVCFDKTGTLTTGRLAVTLVRVGDDDLSPDDPAARRTLTVAARACPAVEDDEVDNVPHATDKAVLQAATRLLDDDWELLSESSFETNRGYAAALGVSDGDRRLAVKGAPEVVLPLCDRVVRADGKQPRRLDDRGRRTAAEVVQELADRGLRLLAVAERTSDLPDMAEDLEPLVEGLTLVGFVGISDSPRDTAEEAVRRMVDAGIRPVMVTGDHPATASAIARQVGLPTDVVTTGAELEGMTEQERVDRAADTTVFARVSPEQKVRIVEALRAAGRVVAMTGDGTNDAAAIRLADVGIGVGTAGSTAARSSADLVLAEPDLPRIHDALVEGRHMWHRMREAVSILVGGNTGEMAFMLLGTAVGGRAPINIRQMLVVNLLTDMFPAMAVALAPSRNEAEAAAPVGSTLGGQLVRAVAVRGTATALGATLAWTAGRFTGRGRRADTMGLAALVGTQLGQTLLIGWRSPLVVATVLASVGVLFVLVETPGVSQLFGCTPIGPLAWTLVVGSSAIGTGAAVLAHRRLPA